MLCTIFHQTSVDQSSLNYPKTFNQFLRRYDWKLKTRPKHRLDPLWVLQVVVRILGELLEQMITDASFASIAEHAALKALLHPVGRAILVFGKGETALISGKRGHEQAN